jgi:hypothetical protein
MVSFTFLMQIQPLYYYDSLLSRLALLLILYPDNLASIVRCGGAGLNDNNI